MIKLRQMQIVWGFKRMPKNYIGVKKNKHESHLEKKINVHLLKNWYCCCFSYWQNDKKKLDIWSEQRTIDAEKRTKCKFETY